MPLDTTFAPAQVDIASGLQDLQKKYQIGRIQQARSSAMKLMQGGDIKGGIAQLMGVGDVDGAKALTLAYRAMNPQMSPYQQAQLANKSPFEGMTPEFRTYCATHPNDPDCQRIVAAHNSAIGGEGQQPQMTMQAGQPQGTTQAPPSSPPPSGGFEKWKQDQEVSNLKAKEQAKIEAKKPSYNDALSMKNSVQSTAKDALAVVDQLLDTPYMTGDASTGIAGRFAIPGSAQATVQANIDGLKGQIGFAMYQKLRDTSRTGSAGLQRLTNAELFMLQNLIRPLDYSKMSWGQIRNNLVSIKSRLENMNADLDAKLKEDYPDQGGGTTEKTTTTAESGLPETAKPSAGDVPIKGAATISKHTTPEQLKGFLDTETTGTLHLSDGRAVRGVKRNGNWYDADTGQLLKTGK